MDMTAGYMGSTYVFILIFHCEVALIPEKNRGWIMKRYWKSVGNKHYVLWIRLRFGKCAIKR
jgi:hypothetical protein